MPPYIPYKISLSLPSAAGLQPPLFFKALYMDKYGLRCYREYSGNMLLNISTMGSNIPDDLAPYFLSPVFIITHSLSFKKIAFLKDKQYFLTHGKAVYQAFFRPSLLFIGHYCIIMIIQKRKPAFEGRDYRSNKC